MRNNDFEFASNLIKDILSRRNLYLPLRDPVPSEETLAPGNLMRLGVIKAFALDNYFWLQELYDGAGNGYTHYLLSKMTNGVWTEANGWESYLDVYKNEMATYLKSKGKESNSGIYEINDIVFHGEHDFKFTKLLRENLFKRDRKEFKMVYETAVNAIENKVIQDWNLHFIHEEKTTYKLSDLKPVTPEEIDFLVNRTENNAELLGLLYVGLSTTKENPTEIIPQSLLDAVIENQSYQMEELLDNGFDLDIVDSINEIFLNRTEYYLSEKPGAGIKDALKRNLESRENPRFRKIDLPYN